MAEEISIKMQLDEWLAAEPFEPFRILMNSGDRFEIDGAAHVAVGSEAITIYRPDSRVIVLRSNQLTALEKP
jgi:hypothetical protein